MSDIDPTPYRRLASNLFSAMTHDIKAAVSRVTDLRRVQAVGDDGRVTVASTNPEAPAPETMARLRGSTYAEGDDVVTLRVAGRDIAIGTIATLADVLADGGSPGATDALEGLLTDLGYQSPIKTQEVLCVVPLTVKYNGVTHTLTDRELAACDKFVYDLPGAIDNVSSGKLRVRVRVVHRSALLDIDAWLADRANYYNGAPDNLANGPFGGKQVHDGIGKRLLTDQYGGQSYDGLVVFYSKAVVNTTNIFGLTSPGYSYINIDDTTLGSADGTWNEGLVHEYGHQIEAIVANGGFPLAYGPDSAGGEQVNGSPKFTLDPQTGYYAFFRDMFTNKVTYSVITTKGPIVNPNPLTELVSLAPVDEKNNWNVVPQRRLDILNGAGGLVNRYPDHFRAGTNVTFTADGEGVLVSATGGTGGPPPGDYNQTIDVYGSGVGLLTGNPATLDFKDGFALSEPTPDLVRFDIAYAGSNGTFGTATTVSRSDHGHLSNAVTDLPEVVQDIVAALLTAGAGIVLTYNDAANTYTIAVNPDVTQSTNFRNVALYGFDGTGVQRFWLSPQNGLQLYDTAAVLRASINNVALALYDASGTTTVVLSTTGTTPSRFALAPTVGPSGSAVAVSIEGHTQTSATITDFAEAAQDAVAAMLAAGTGVTLAYNDAANTLTITGTTGGGGGTTDPEIVRDTIGVALIGAGLVTVTVNDAADTITLSTTATVNSTDAALRDRATHTGAQVIATVTGLQGAIDAKAPLASPAFTGTPTGVTKAHVGLPNVDNTADTAKAFAASQITSGVIAPARHGTGTADATTVLYGDGAFRTAPPGTRVPYATTSYTFDDFIGGTNGSGNIGQIGWNTAGGNVNTPAAEANHPGILGRNSGATANTYAWTRLIFGCMASDLFDLIYLFRLDAGSAGTDTLVRLGLGTTGTANPDTDGVYLEKLAADATWFFVTRVGGVQTRTDSGVAVAANVWIKVQMRRISGTQIGFRLNAGAEVIQTASLPTISLLPFFAVMGTTTTARGLGVDFFDLQVAVTR